MKRKPVINAHCHLLNFNFVPDRMTKLLSNIPEKIADDRWLSVAAGFLAAILPGKKYNGIKKYLKTYKESIDEVTHDYMQELKRAKIDICTPLMMDLRIASGDLDAHDLPYITNDGTSNQIDLISEQVAKYPWQIFPFVMFDPRRTNSDTICIEAIEKKGFIGVKMYPALGYHPSWRIMKNPGPMWDGVVAADSDAAVRLKNLYQYCSEKKVPITTHASIGGAYSVYKDDEGRMTGAWPLTELSNWIDAIREYNLKINFAHFGGNYLHKTRYKRQQSINWRREILNFIARSKSENYFGKIYTDLSFHDMAHSKNTRQQYFSDLRQLLGKSEYSSRILYGSDASMISHTWTESEFMKPFKTDSNLKPALQNKIFKDNAVGFLFENAQIPVNYIEFLKKKCGEKPFKELKDWIREENGNYYIVSEG